MRLCAALLAAVALSACAHAKPAQSSAELPASLLAPAQAQRLRSLAPDFLARAERAQARANAAEAPEAANEHAECARLLLAAAELEAERIELERRLLAEELRRDAALQQLASARYAALASQPSAAVVPQPGAAAKPSADAQVKQARLQLAAARALGAPPVSLAQVERQIVRAIADPSQARAALEQAERVFEAARKPRAP